MGQVLTIKGNNPDPEFIKLITGALVPPGPDEAITVFQPEDLEEVIAGRLGYDAWNFLRDCFREPVQETGETEQSEVDCCYEEIREKDDVLSETLGALNGLRSWLSERKRWQRENVFEQVDIMISRLGKHLLVEEPELEPEIDGSDVVPF